MSTVRPFIPESFDTPVASRADPASGTVRVTPRRGQAIARIQLIVITFGALVLGALCLLPAVMPVVQGPFWFLLKVACLIFFYVWTRGTLPRFRYDQLMSLGWKLLLPVSLANLVGTALWIVFPLLVKHG